MTVKYNVSGAKTRNGKTIMSMDFDDKRAAERFANYHEGIAVHSNIRQHPGRVQAVIHDANGLTPPVKSFALHNQVICRSERKSPPVTFIVDPKVFMAGIEEHTGPLQILKLPKEIVCELTDPLDKELTDKVAARVLTYDPTKAISLADMQARYAQPLERPATVPPVGKSREVRFAEAIVDKHRDNEWSCCQFCEEREIFTPDDTQPSGGTSCIAHLPSCVVLEAEAFLKEKQ